MGKKEAEKQIEEMRAAALDMLKETRALGKEIFGETLTPIQVLELFDRFDSVGEIEPVMEDLQAAMAQAHELFSSTKFEVVLGIYDRFYAVEGEDAKDEDE
jgi:hypothetical protein